MNKMMNRQMVKEKGKWDKPFPQLLIMWCSLSFGMTVKQVIFSFQRRACPDKAACKTSLFAAFKISNLIKTTKHYFRDTVQSMLKPEAYKIARKQIYLPIIHGKQKSGVILQSQSLSLAENT